MNEAELVFTEILNCNRTSLYLDENLKWDKDKSIAVSSVIKRRMLAEPLQYIFGKTEFMGLEFRVNPDVFIPRQETEILVEEVMELTRDLAVCKTDRIQILDMGTGSGCIAASLAKFLTSIEVHAVDISARALEIAQYNAGMHNVKVDFIHSDLFNSCGLKPGSYDIIVSNPPYIPRAQINDLEAEVKYEPEIALDGGDDGLDFYRRIIAQAPSYLNAGGFLAMEIGFNQAGAIKNIFRGSGDFKIIKVVKDYNRIERVITAKKVE